MNSTRAVKFLDMYSKCPKCGNDKIRQGEDFLEITEDEFIFNCSCGFYAHVVEKKNFVYDPK